MKGKKTTTSSNVLNFDGYKLISLGDGKIVVSSGVQNVCFPMGILSLFSSKKKRKVGETIKRGSKLDSKYPEVSILFHNTESVDVVLKALMSIRAQMYLIDKANNKEIVCENTRKGWLVGKTNGR